MNERATKLREQPGGAEVGAVMHDLLTLESLFAAEEQWCVPRTGVLRELAAAGIQLMGLALRWSLSLGYGGRVGLHALDQAKTFYENRCGMQNLGPDATYQDLSYFEFTEANAGKFLRSKP